MPLTPTAIVSSSWSHVKNKVRIIVPGQTHILSAEIGRTNAPRILRDIEGDFDVKRSGRRQRATREGNRRRPCIPLIMGPGS